MTTSRCKRSILATAVGITMIATLPVGSQSMPVPSGATVTPLEVIWEPQHDGSLWARFRYLVPQIARTGGTLGFDAAQRDMAHLCATTARPVIAADGRAVSVVVVSFADRPLPFGETDPEATQFFEAFRLVGDTCEVEPL